MSAVDESNNEYVYGTVWDKAEDNKLILKFNQGISIDELAKLLNRPKPDIIARLLKYNLVSPYNYPEIYKLMLNIPQTTEHKPNYINESQVKQMITYEISKFGAELRTDINQIKTTIAELTSTIKTLEYATASANLF